MIPMLLTLLALAAQPAADEQPATPAAPDPRPYVALVTDLGTITVRIEDRRAPVTPKNFLRYVDTKRMDGLNFYSYTRTWGGRKRGGEGTSRELREELEGTRKNKKKPTHNKH